ncbi:putative ribonuclease H-like domain-containing protein [Tanacetum coccineum]
MRLLDVLMTIHKYLDQLGKFDGKSEEGYLLGYSTNSKGFRVYNRVTRKVQDCIHVNFLENQENQKGKGPDWMFDLELLSPSMNYILVRKENYDDSGEKVSTYDDVEDLDDQQFIVHGPSINAVQNKHSEERTADKEVPLSSEDTSARHDGVYCWDYHKKEALKKVFDKPCLAVFYYKQTELTTKINITCLLLVSYLRGTQERIQALADESWVEAMQEELLQFKLQEVWVLCDLPDGKRVIGTKWVFRNKRDERGTIIKNKARLVAQGYRQEEGVDYDEVFAPVARIEAIRLFLAFASFMGFTVYQMDVKSAFLYGNITEEVYVKQLRRGAIDKTLFIKKDRRDIMLVQVYVDDIIFGSTKSSMVKDFEDLMQKEFKMSSMGELTFFLGLQVKQTTAGIFLSQDKYVKDILNKFDFRTIKPASTPIEAHKSLGKDEEGEEVDVHLYRSMIGCLMYLTASRPDIMFAVCLCARFQVTPKVSHMHAVKGSLVTMLGTIMIDDQLQEDVNILEEDWSLGNARNKQLWLSPLQKQNIVVKALYGLHQAPRAWYERLSTFLLKHGYRRGAIDKTLFIKKDRRDIMLVQVYVDDIIFGSTKSSMVKDFEDLMQKEFKMSSMGELTFFLGLQVKQTSAGIFLSQDKYVKDILNKFDFRTIKPASTPIEAHKSLGKDEEGEDVDVHLYRSMIGCLMYLTASRPDIMFAVCLCARFQVTPKVSHLHAVKRIFRYLKHQPKLGLWYPKDSPFHLEAFSDSDYAGDNHDRRSTSGGCQYLGRRLVSWQCKKQTIVAISSTEAEYVAAASCCAQVLWMQNQLLDYGFNFMNTEIHIDNESTICIVKNPVLHSKTKHIQIRHHFIRDCYEQRLINVVKVHTDDNVADLLTKGFDLARFNFLVVTIESLEALLLRLRGGYE